MRSPVLGLALIVALTATSPRADEPRITRSRGAASALGLTLLALSLGGAGLGVGGLVSISEAQAVLHPYLLQGGASAAPELALALDARIASSTTLAIAGMVTAGACLVAGVLLLVADAPTAGLAFAPIPGGGGLLSYSHAW